MVRTAVYRGEMRDFRRVWMNWMVMGDLGGWEVWENGKNGYEPDGDGVPGRMGILSALGACGSVRRGPVCFVPGVKSAGVRRRTISFMT